MIGVASMPWLSPRPPRRARPASRVPALVAIAAVVVAIASAMACGTSAVGVDACNEIETARCHIAPSCGVDLTDPVHRDGTDVSSCIRYYSIACLHGVDLSSAPSNAEVTACVNAINNDGCGTVVTPESDPACSWLSPVVVDAGADADADDGDDGSDASDGAAE